MELTVPSSIRPPSKKPTVEQVINRAHELISEHGWTQNIARNAEGSLCLAFAIHESVREFCQTNDFDLIDETKKFVKAKCGLPPYGDLVAWNDQSGRTKEEVLEVLKYE